MREIKIVKAVYKIDELTEAAQEKAVAEIAERLSGIWWDDSNRETVRDTMVYAFAEKLGTPGREKYGQGDYPGIDGVTLGGWSLDRGEEIAFAGTLTRENAPALPWPDMFEQVDLIAGRGDRYTVVDLVEREVPCTCDPSRCGSQGDGCPATAPREVDNEGAAALKEAVEAAISAAWAAGRAEDEYQTGEERAREVADDHEFLIDGTFYA